MYCAKCGSFLEEDEIFCSNCGAVVVLPLDETADEPSGDEPIAAEPTAAKPEVDTVSAAEPTVQMPAATEFNQTGVEAPVETPIDIPAIPEHAATPEYTEVHYNPNSRSAPNKYVVISVLAGVAIAIGIGAFLTNGFGLLGSRNQTSAQDLATAEQAEVEDEAEATAPTAQETVESQAQEVAQSTPQPQEVSTPPAQTVAEPVNVATPADSLPREWTGTIENQMGDGTVDTNCLHVAFTHVNDDGSVSGICEVTEGLNRTGNFKGSYYIDGYIDWSTGDIELWWTGWIDQGILENKRQYSGRLDSSYQTITGKLENLSGNYPGAWSMTAD